MAHKKVTKKQQARSNSNFIEKRDRFMAHNSIELSPLSKMDYSKLKASGVTDSDMVDKMKARGY